MTVFSESALDGAREFATTAVGAVKGVTGLYQQYEREAAEHVNQVPVVKYAGSTPARIGKGNTNIPNLEIVDWIDRPADLQDSNGTSAKPAGTVNQATVQAASDPNDKIPCSL